MNLYVDIHKLHRIDKTKKITSSLYKTYAVKGNNCLHPIVLVSSRFLFLINVKIVQISDD